jgi:hypothetical protein
VTTTMPAEDHDAFFAPPPNPPGASRASANDHGGGAIISGTHSNNDQRPPRTSAPSAAAAAAGVMFASVLLPSMIPLPGSTVRPSTAIEAQVHASIRGASFAVPPLSSSASLSASSSSDVPTPEVFRNRRLRSGKWIKEEELYADGLIEQFEGGVAPDCPSGVTLRAYLSKKLHCAPMRISKKYAGKGIGKMVFVSKAGGSDGASGSSSSSSGGPEERRRREALAKEREDRFYKAAFRSNDFLGVRVGRHRGGGGRCTVLCACAWDECIVSRGAPFCCRSRTALCLDRRPRTRL